jgi:hypothetical protein
MYGVCRVSQGNIMHGSLALHQLFFARPAFGYATHRSPVEGLYLCGAGAHPGGGVMGAGGLPLPCPFASGSHLGLPACAAGRNCAMVVSSDLGKPLFLKATP